MAYSEKRKKSLAFVVARPVIPLLLVPLQLIVPLVSPLLAVPPVVPL